MPGCCPLCDIDSFFSFSVDWRSLTDFRNALFYYFTFEIALFFFFLTYRAEAATNPLTSSLVKRSPKIDFGMARDYSGGREAATLLGAAVARDPFGPGRKRSVTEDSKQRSFYVSGVLSGEEAWWLCWWWWYNAFRKIKFCLEFEGMFLFCFCFPFCVS